MVGEEIPNAIYIFLGIYTIALLVLAFFYQSLLYKKELKCIYKYNMCIFMVHNIINDRSFSFGFVFEFFIRSKR